MDERKMNDEQRDFLLIRLDERTSSQEKVLIELKNIIEKNYVTQDQFRPVRLCVFGFVALILTSVVGALIAVVVKGVSHGSVVA